MRLRVCQNIGAFISVLGIATLGYVKLAHMLLISEGVRTWSSYELKDKACSKEKALLAMYGLQNRDHGCAWASHLHIREALQSMGYQVDMFVYDMRPDTGERVDGVSWSSGTLQNESNVHYEWEKMSAIDAKIKHKCGERLHRCSKRFSRDSRYVYPGIIKALRQLYAENYVANFLDSVMEREYKLVVAVASDIMVLQDISRTQIIPVPNNTLFVSGDGNYGGYTNGLYIGNVRVVSSVMRRWIPFSSGNYESWLARACEDNGLKVSQLENHSYGRSFAKIRHNGRLKKRRGWSGRLELAWKVRATSCLMKYIANAT